MKKNNFFEGSFIATLGIVVCKIIGLLYVIPFYAMISSKGATLYSFAYSIYTVFLSLSTSGIPIAMSKLVSEYNSLEYYNTKEKVYKIGKYIIIGLGIFFFIVLMITAPAIANFILGKNSSGGNTVSDVAFVIRLISTALLVVPILSVTKGYLQGHKYMTPSSISNVIEQIIRVAVILIGCFVSLKIMGLEEKIAIGISVLAATIGAFFAYIYLYIKLKKNHEIKKNSDIEKKSDETKYTSKYLIKQIFLYALPFIVIDLLKSSYNLVDTFTITRTLSSLGYSNEVTDLTFATIATWGNKLSMIIISISMGITASLIPSLASDYVLKKQNEINNKVNGAIRLLLFITIPMTIGLCFLARPIWIVFYSYDTLSISVFKVFIFQAITFSLFSVLLNITQTTNFTKATILTLLASFIGNALLNIPMMKLFDIWKIGYQGASISTLITQIIPIIFLMIFIAKKLKVNYKKTFIIIAKITISSLIMLLVLFLFTKIYPLNTLTKGKSLIQTIVYSIIGMVVYLICVIKMGVIKEIFNNSNILNKLKNKIKTKKI